jgi:hypothetical protein
MTPARAASLTIEPVPTTERGQELVPLDSAEVAHATRRFYTSRRACQWVRRGSGTSFETRARSERLSKPASDPLVARRCGRDASSPRLTRARHCCASPTRPASPCFYLCRPLGHHCHNEPPMARTGTSLGPGGSIRRGRARLGSEGSSAIRPGAGADSLQPPWAAEDSWSISAVCLGSAFPPQAGSSASCRPAVAA